MKANLQGLLTGIFLATCVSGMGQISITSQPQNQTNVAGTTATFTVEATGAEPLAYQWQHAFDLFNYVLLPDGTNSTLVLTNVQNVDSGNYRVMITNTLGSVSSSVARLYVIALPTLQFSSGTCSVAENAGGVTLSVRRTGYLEPAVTVDYATADGTAANGLKYTAVSGTLTFGSGETNKEILVPILNNGLIDGTKSFWVSLTNAGGGAVLGTQARASVQILDNDKGLALEFSSYRAVENESYVLIGVTRGDDGDFPIAVDVRTADGTAIAGQDYAGVTTNLSFAPGERLKLLTVPIVNDGLKEANETFRLTLQNPGGGGVLGSPASATVTLIDNDPGIQFTYAWTGEFTRTVYGAHEYEGEVDLVVTRGNDGLLDPFMVHYAARDLTATNGLDYELPEGVLEFAIGETKRVLSIPIANDGVAEPDEQFQVVLSGPTGAIGLGGSTTITVTIWDSTGWTPHDIAGIRAVDANNMELRLAGNLPGRFRSFFDLYLLDTSSGLVEWAPWSHALRTNTVAAPQLQFAVTPDEPVRFYATRPETLLTPRESPTGPYTVGLLNRWVRDPTRRNRYNVSTNDSLWMTVWYPASRPAGQLPAPFLEPAIIRGALPEAWQDRVTRMYSYAFLNTPLLPGSARFPVVLASHGADALRIQNDERAENLASHGYIVVATDHRDNLGMVFPDGSYHSTPEGVTDAGMRNRVMDFDFLLGQVTAWNQDDPFFAGRLDLDRVAAMGFSWGGATAAEICRTDSRFRAAVLLDPGGFTTETVNQGLAIPSLTINSSGNSDLGVFSRAVPGSVWLQISSTKHESFTDIAFIISGYSMQSIYEADRTIDAYVLAFLNRQVKGQPANFPLPGLPRAVNVQVK